MSAAAAGPPVISPSLVATLWRDDWSVPNFRGRSVSRLGGPAFAAAAFAAAAIAGAPLGPTVSAAGGALLTGRIDDVYGSSDLRGLHGHLGQLRRGHISTGTVKIAMLAATGTLTALCLRRSHTGAQPRAGTDSLSELAAIAGCVALSANLANLFDLRPGRALKVTLAATLPLGVGESAGASTLAGVAAAAMACLAADLTERTMLGDAGANPAGALTGLGLALRAGPRARWLLLAGMLALTVASEVVSFSQVITDARPLRWFDQLGRSAPG